MFQSCQIFRESFFLLLGGGGGGLTHICQTFAGCCFFIQNLNFVFDNLHLQIMASISPKASVENSSAQWAIIIQYQQSGWHIYLISYCE